MKGLHLLIAAALIASMLPGSARADDLEPSVTNPLLPPLTLPGNPTAGQFGGYSSVSSTAPPLSGASGDVRLQKSLLGASFAGSPPEFSIGDTIGVPLVIFTDAQGRPVALRREPVRKSDPAFRCRTLTNPTILDFAPSTAILSDRFHWSPDAHFEVLPDAAGLNERLTEGAEAGTGQDGFVYASQAGNSRIFWRTAAPVGADGGNQPVYGLVERSVSVASSSRLPVRRIFWTEQGYQGPPVAVPKGEIQQVRIAYTDAFPELVPDGSQVIPPGGSDPNVPITRRTLWYDNNALRCYNREGRMLVEFLSEIRTSGGLRRQVGVEVVDVIQEALPVLVEQPIGERLYPLPPEQSSQQNYPLPPDAGLRAAYLRRIADNLALYNPALVLNLHAVAESYTTQFEISSQLAYYATRATTSASDVQVFWREPGLGLVQWPKFLNRYHQYWPQQLSDYAVNIRPSDNSLVSHTPPIFANTAPFELVYQDDPNASQARIGEGMTFEVGLNSSDPVNRSLLLFRSGNDFWFLRIESVLDSAMTDSRYASQYADSVSPGVPLTALVGARIEPPPQADSRAGYVDLTKDDAIDPSAYVDPFASGIPAAEAGAIIPVNAALFKNGRANNKLGVWWFKKITPPAGLTAQFSPVYWPSYYRSYTLQWPVDAPPIVLASNLGSGDLPADVAAGSIYYQNDPDKVGYNPNEEHAQMISGRAYALRDDLNNPDRTSGDYVLIRYTSAADLRPAMRTFHVLREDGPYTFRYDAKAGTVLQAPMPLAIMPPPLQPNGKSRNTEVTPLNADPPVAPNLPGYYGAFTFEDRKGLKWIYRGRHNSAAPALNLGMKFYYATREGFAYPNATTGRDEAPPVGTLTPYLADTNEDKKTGIAITISFTPYWPDLMPRIEDRDEVPALQLAETLVDSKYGLPSLRGASSAAILYQQSVALAANKKSAVLHDPTRRKTYLLSATGLGAIPSSIATSQSNGRTYFQLLPAHLQQRFYLDPTLGPDHPPRGGLVLEGQFKDEIVGEDYLLPNILSADDIAALKRLVASTDPQRGKWEDAMDGLSTKLETFIENPAVPGTYIAQTNPAPPQFGDTALVEVTNDDQAVDSYALTAVGGGSGYVTLILGNGRAFTDQSEPVQVHILRVGPTDLYRGQIKPILALNPLSESVTMQHTGDFGGHVEDFDYEWYYTPPVDGQPPANMPDQPGTSWFLQPGNQPRVIVGGTQPLLTLTDNYYAMRYRPKAGKDPRSGPSAGTWSAWTAPALAEGWIKRVLGGINPFNQRLSDFYNNAINTDVSLLTQAGTRWEGDVPLTLKSAQEAGLIEIYETVLHRGIGFSIDGTPAIDYGPANDALLLAAGYLNDLYMALGNEAYADASNPLISLDVDPSRLLVQQGLPASLGASIQSTASSRFAFDGQVPTLLDEELVLLRGRDDFLVPGARQSPVYNRFFWNYTRGINAGEVIYALNYNITEKAGSGADGKIDATDAARQYPQGHGDAYGHYLTALKNYYRLLSDSEFTWTPRVEAVNILGVPVTVDYRDERKLAAAAVSLGRTASRIIDLERRKLPVGTASGWADLRDSKANTSTGITRSWGVEQWAARAGQGNFIHWAVVNALLPENDIAHEGLQKIDRHSVPELDELAALGSELQDHLDGANRRVNALDLSDDSILFDLSPGQVAAGSSHFDQVLARAKAALANVATAHARTVEQNALLRTVENQAADYSFTVAEQEAAFELRLLDIYGQPYSGDIGPGKTYPQGYAGPDYFRYMYVSRPYVYNAAELIGSTPGADGYYTVYLPIYSSDYASRIAKFNGKNSAADALIREYGPYAPSHGNPIDSTYTLTYRLSLTEGPYQIAPSSMGSRTSTGQLQTAMTRIMRSKEQLLNKLRTLDSNRTDFATKVKYFAEDLAAENQTYTNNQAYQATKLALTKTQGAVELIDAILSRTEKTNLEVAKAASEAFPKVTGVLDNDVTSPARAAVIAQAIISNTTVSVKTLVGKGLVYLLDVGVAVGEMVKDQANRELDVGVKTRARITQLQTAYGAVFGGVKDLDAAIGDLQSSLENYQNVLSTGETIQAERETFRKRAAAVIQGARVRDVAFRAFRTESLEQYKVLYDQAARYTFLAAKAYDYDTALLGNNNGRNFLAGIVSTRSLGLVGAGGEPQFAGANSGDAGLSSSLAKLQADWSVAKGRLGINNPDTYGTIFSLRRELFNLPYREDGTAEDHVPWQDKLRSCLVTDLRMDPAVAAHALPTSNPSGLAQPGFIISFPTSIETGLNFFGNPLGAGDSAYSTASYSTKIHSVGVVFQGYLGMNPYVPGNPGIPAAPTHSSPDALGATPYVYLIPAGKDLMRTPPLNGAPVTVREWLVHDHAMPLPYDIGNSGFGQNTSWTSATSLSEPFFLPRKYQPFRATDSPFTYFLPNAPDFTNSRLIGRSVWNTQWKLVIPAQVLLANPAEGIERFIRSVKDIKIYLRTYSYSGN